MTLREALGFFIQREIARREERRHSMASRCGSSSVRELAGFEFERKPSGPGVIGELAVADGSRMAITTAAWPPVPA